MPDHTKCCTCHAKSSSQNWRSYAPKCNPFQEHVSHLPSFLKLPQNHHVLLTFEKVHNPHRLPRKTRPEPLKVLRTPQFFALLTSKCASHHNGVHFFDIATSKSATCKCASRRNRVHFFNIATSKSGPTLVCFVQFELEMCFAPQQPAFFRHRNF